MSEGEFKKRINNLISTHDEEDLLGIEGHLELIKDYIDDAKKEFPQCIDCDYYVGDMESNGHCTLDDKVDSSGCPKDEWFLKYFGG